MVGVTPLSDLHLTTRQGQGQPQTSSILDLPILPRHLHTSRARAPPSHALPTSTDSRRRPRGRSRWVAGNPAELTYPTFGKRRCGSRAVNVGGGGKSGRSGRWKKRVWEPGSECVCVGGDPVDPAVEKRQWNKGKLHPAILPLHSLRPCRSLPSTLIHAHTGPPPHGGAAV